MSLQMVVTFCLHFVTMRTYFGQNGDLWNPCQKQKRRFEPFIGPEFGLVGRSAFRDLAWSGDQARGFVGLFLGPVPTHALLPFCQHDPCLASKVFLALVTLRFSRGDEYLQVFLFWHPLIHSSSGNAPGRTRTCNLWVRSPTLYPIELRAHKMIGPCHTLGTRQAGSCLPIVLPRTLRAMRPR